MHYHDINRFIVKLVYLVMHLQHFSSQESDRLIAQELGGLVRPGVLKYFVARPKK